MAIYFDENFNDQFYYIHLLASSEEAGDLAVTSDKLLPLNEFCDDTALNNIAVSRAINIACRKSILGQVCLV